jgi:hypothetical protein
MLSTIILSKNGTSSIKSIISKIIGSCIEEHDIDKKIETLYPYKFNTSLKSQKLKIPSLLTDDYVETSLYNIEQTQII